MTSTTRSRTRLKSSTPVARRSSELTNRGNGLASRTMATVRKVGSPKIYVPLLLAAGVGAAIFGRLMWPRRTGPRARIAGAVAELQPHVAATVRRLADLGREMRDRIR